MAKKIFLFFLWLIPASVMAQVTINVQLPASGFVNKDQLWNLIILNPEADLNNVLIQMELMDAKSGNVFLTATTSPINFPNGTKIISNQEVGLVNYNIINADFSKNFLPMGVYTICYQLVMAQGYTESPIARECVHLNIDPLSPPLLISPGDKSALQTPYPQFIWLPPAPAEMFSSLNYDLLVSEVLPGQSPVEAIQYNSPVYSRGNLNQTFENYSTAFAALDTGKIYAWQVIAKNGQGYAGKTEVWTFNIINDSIAKIIDQAPFIKMSKGNTELTILNQGILKVEYLNAVNDQKITCRIYKIADKGKDNKKTVQFELNLKRGQNFLRYDVSQKAKLEEKVVYEVSLINSIGEEWLMKIIPVYYKN